MKTFTLTLPSHWSNCLINGDHGYLTAEERDTIDRLLRANNADSGALSCEPAGFRTFHDATAYGVLACDCEEFTFHIY